MNIARRLILIWVLALFAISCNLTAGHGHGGFLEDGADPEGWRMLLFGWMMPPGLICVAWLANPLLFFALYCFWHKEYKWAAVFSGIAGGISLVPMAAFGIPDDVRLEWPMALMYDGGRLELRAGYGLWVVTHFVAFSCAGVLWYLGERSRGYSKMREMNQEILPIPNDAEVIAPKTGREG